MRNILPLEWKKAKKQPVFWIKCVIWVGMLALTGWLAWQWYKLLYGSVDDYINSPLGANPIEYTVRMLGIWGLRLLLVTLAISPLSRLYRPIMRVRRLVGLWAFALVAMHFFFYIGIDIEWNWVRLFREVVKSPFITFGMLAFVMLIPLAVTSTARMIKRLGAKRWQKLHRLVYLLSFLAAIHFIYMVKGFQPTPYIYLAIYGVLMLFRVKVGELFLGGAKP